MNKMKNGAFYVIFLMILGFFFILAHIYGGAGASISLITPYINESDMESINEAFSINECAPWGFGDHLGIDFFPTGTIGDPNGYKSFQSVCDGTVLYISPYYNPAGGPNGVGQHQVNVEIEYDSTYSVVYAFETWSDLPADGDAQLLNILSHISENQSILQGHIIGELVKAGNAAHVHFGLRENGLDVCPEPYFTPSARLSVLNILHKTYPFALMCYGLEGTIPIANISIDGNTPDWAGINPLIWDWDDFYSPDFPGADIQALYLARDSNNLYLRLDLWEDANPNFGNAPYPYGGRYSFRIINNGTYPDLFLSVAGGYMQWSLGFNGSNGPGTPALLNDRPDLVGVNGNVIEVKVPLPIIGYPTEIQRIYAETSDCCINIGNVTVLDETHCMSNLHTSYQSPSIKSLLEKVSLFYEMGWIERLSVKNSLIRKLKLAERLIKSNRIIAAKATLRAFIMQVRWSRRINPTAKKYLIDDAQYITSNL